MASKTDELAEPVGVPTKSTPASKRGATIFEPTGWFVTERGNAHNNDVPETIRDKINLEDFFEGRLHGNILLNQEGENAFSLVEVYYPPNTMIPRHQHNLDQVIYILDGEARQGNLILRPGDGYHTPAGTAYGLKVGPRGVRMLEFRHGSVNGLTTKWVEDNPARWTHEG